MDACRGRDSRLAQPVAQRGDVVGTDLAATADDGRAGIDPAQGEIRVAGGAEIIAGVEDVDAGAVLEPVDGGEGVGVCADGASQRDQIGDRGVDGLRPAAIDETGGERDVLHGVRGGRQRLAAAQPGRPVMGQRPRQPDRLAALGGGEHRGAAFLRGRHRLAQHEIDAIRLLGDDPAIDAQRLVERDRQRGVVAAEQRDRQPAISTSSPCRAVSRADSARSSARLCNGSNISPSPSRASRSGVAA